MARKTEKKQPVGPERLTPAQWQRRKRVEIVVPRGWTMSDKPFDEPIEEGEFDGRLANSHYRHIGARETR